jgi:hypothetical protein
MAKRPRPPTVKEEVARRLAGLPARGKLPELGTQARKAYRSAQRAAQRAAKKPGQVNPKTGKAYQMRVGAKVSTTRAQIAKERRLARKKSVTLKNVTAMVTINDDPRYRRRRSFGDISLSGAGYRRFIRQEITAMDILTEHLGREAGFDDAAGIASYDISDVRAADAE